MFICYNLQFKLWVDTIYNSNSHFKLASACSTSQTELALEIEQLNVKIFLGLEETGNSWVDMSSGASEAL